MADESHPQSTHSKTEQRPVSWGKSAARNPKRNKTSRSRQASSANGGVTQAMPSKASRRALRAFPASSFEEALALAEAAFEYGSGQPVRRLSLFDHLGKSPESGPSRQWVTNAGKYGLLKGGYQADQLEMTPDGIRAVSEEVPARERTRVRVKLAIEDIEPFRQLYERLAGNKLPVRAAMVDAIQEFGVPPAQAEEAVDTFVVNGFSAFSRHFLAQSAL